MSRHISLVTIACIMLFSLVNARYISDEDFKSKRQTGDIKTAEYQAWLALGGFVPSGCTKVACGVIDIHNRTKRTSSDQRIAEIKANLALNKVAGHGDFDFDDIGKRKRSDFSSEDISRSILAQRLLQYATARLANAE
ncbi:uncharacterized protein LOC106873782 [Argonauta hians]